LTGSVARSFGPPNTPRVQCRPAKKVSFFDGADDVLYFSFPRFKKNLYPKLLYPLKIFVIATPKELSSSFSSFATATGHGRK